MTVQEMARLKVGDKLWSKIGLGLYEVIFIEGDAVTMRSNLSEQDTLWRMRAIKAGFTVHKGN